MNHPSNFLHCFLLQLATSETSNHDSLIRQIKFLLRSYHLPGFIYKESEAVHRNPALRVISALEKVFIRLLIKETVLQREATLHELVWFEDLVREKLEIKVEIVKGCHVFKVLWLVNLTPDGLDVLLNDLTNNLLVVVSWIKVSKDKKKELFRSILLRHLLVPEEFHVDLKYNSQ
jgi:hypothetical protein